MDAFFAPAEIGGGAYFAPLLAPGDLAAALGWTEANDVAAITGAVVQPDGASAAIGWVEGADTAAISATVSPPGTTAASIGWAEADDSAALVASVYNPVPAGVEPVSLAEAKRHLRVVFDDDDEDIERLITAARMMVERRTQRALVLREEVLALDCYPDAVRLPHPPLQAVLSFDYTDPDGDDQTIPDTAYRVNTYVEPARITRASGATWPTAISEEAAIRVRYRAGYPSPAAVPAPLKQWMLLAIGAMYDNRDQFIVGASVAPLPEDFMGLLWQPYMVYM